MLCRVNRQKYKQTTKMTQQACENMEKQLISELKFINCCSYCIIRFLNEKSSSAYQNPNEFLGKLLGESNESDDPKEKTRKLNPCSACLGLLQPLLKDELSLKVEQDVKDAGYDSQDVTFALSLPISLQIRNYSIWLHVSQKFHSYYMERQIYNDFASYGDMKAEGNVVSIKEAWKMAAAPDIARNVGKVLNNGINSHFFVNVNLDYPEDIEETACMALMHPDIFGGRENQKRKYHNEVFTRKSVELALDKTSKELFVDYSPVPPTIPTSNLFCSSVVCSHDSLYIAGRYNKFSRCLSQTPWLINGERRMESSVEELISEPVARKIPHDAIKFASSGREDVDVRTLGSGRPFVLDIQNPKVTQLSFHELRALEKEINSSTSAVFVRDLQIVDKKDLVHIKTGERMKTKTYDCLCVVRGSSDSEKQKRLEDDVRLKLKTLCDAEPFVIQQKTPVRVLHRRPLAIRPRTVHWVKAEFSETKSENIFFKLQIKVEAGTYIKELVHGDLGRTKPNISLMIGLDVDILALDVEEVDLPWPPPVPVPT